MIMKYLHRQVGATLSLFYDIKSDFGSTDIPVCEFLTDTDDTDKNVCATKKSFFSCAIVPHLIIILHSLILSLGTANAEGNDRKEKIIVLSPAMDAVVIGTQCQYAEDTRKTLTIDSVSAPSFSRFAESFQENLNFGFTRSDYWLRFTIQNTATSVNDWLLEISYPHLDIIEFYEQEGSSTGTSSAEWKMKKYGDFLPFDTRSIKHRNFVIPLHLPDSAKRTFYIKVEASGSLQVPMTISRTHAFYAKSLQTEILFGLLYGILSVMALYNLFVFFSLRSVSYLFYVLYIIPLGVEYFAGSGHAYQYWWSESSWWQNQVFLVTNGLWRAALCAFAYKFLDAKVFLPAFLRYALVTLGGVSLGMIVVSMLFITEFVRVAGAFQVIAVTTTVLISGAAAWQRGNNSARFLVIAMSTFLLGSVINMLRIADIVPSMLVTEYGTHIGSMIEVVVLSLALADRYRIMRLDKEQTQQQMLAMQTEANQLLEKKVLVRTRELESKNEEIQRQLFILDTQAHEIGETNAALQEKNMLLEEANNELKEVYHSLQIAQAQVIQTEKMASLGQLTAGIAHEINNPINYIVGGVTLLKENIGLIERMLELYDRAANEHHLHQYFSEVEALKREQRLDVLIPHTFKTVEVIAEGAKRTEEIVRGLRTFARPYDNALKKSNINENLDLTVEFLQHQCRGRITIIKHYGALPEIECVPGELNQVFMNILVNAIQAIPPKQQGEITIRTEQKGEEVYICIKDNGQGISSANRQKIFEPFFTTKDIGKGTGLGLYISFTIIEKHQGDISVESAEGQGTEFCIRLPLHQS